MGLFSKKDACPVCGGEVKGLFLIKIGDKQTLCKNCSKQISMNKSLLETATPEFIREHLDYRKKNAEKYASHNWSVKIHSIPGFQFGLDEAGKAIYLIHDDLHDNEDNPVVLSFDQLTGYELYRRKKKMDDMENTGPITLDTKLSAIGGIAQFAGNKTASAESFQLKLTTTDPYWKEMDIKIDFTSTQLHGLGGFAKDMRQVCQIIKNIIRKEPIRYEN